jgi:hypothetical protein
VRRGNVLTVLASLRTRARPLARIGCVAVGTVYILVGALALLALSGRLIEAADEERLVPLVMGVPGGPIVIWAIVLGAAASNNWSSRRCSDGRVENY